MTNTEAVPIECPQCDTIILGGTPEDWYRHFDEDCNRLGTLYTFAKKPRRATR